MLWCVVWYCAFYYNLPTVTPMYLKSPSKRLYLVSIIKPDYRLSLVHYKKSNKRDSAIQNEIFSPQKLYCFVVGETAFAKTHWTHYIFVSFSLILLNQFETPSLLHCHLQIDWLFCSNLSLLQKFKVQKKKTQSFSTVTENKSVFKTEKSIKY